MSNEITITAYEFKKLKKLYKEAVDEGKKIFVFQGKELVTDYAKYLIQYIEGITKEA